MKVEMKSLFVIQSMAEVRKRGVESHRGGES